MKKIVSIFMIIMLFISATAPASSASMKSTVHKGTYYVKEKTLKVYKSPKTTSKIVTVVKKGTKIKAAKKTKVKNYIWYYISTGKKKGWVQSSKVTTKKPAQKKTDLEKLNQLAKKYKVKVKYRKDDDGTKVYNLLLKGYEEGWIEVRSETTTFEHMYFYEGIHMQIFKSLTNMGIDSAIELGFPVSKKELTSLAKKAQAKPHTAYKTKDGRVRVYADRGKTLSLDYYKAELPDY